MAGHVETFQRLHESGCFVIPNPWDTGTARYLQYIGFKALATTSAGVAFTKGLPDTITAIPRDAMLNHIAEIVRATALPVNADFQHGYADSPDGVAANVKLCIETGVAGLSIEDATGNGSSPLYERKLAIERIRAARESIDNCKSKVLLTARCEAFLVGEPNPFETVLDRLVAFAEVGADCLYAPGLRTLDQVEKIVRAVSPKPVNVLVSSSIPGFTVSSLGSLGVRRVSVGSALARTAWGAFARAAKDIAENGSFDEFSKAASFAELNEVFER